MPEGPEVYRICVYLRDIILGTIVTDFWNPDEGLIQVNATVIDVFSKGKRIIVSFDNGYSIMLMFALTGKIEIDTSVNYDTVRAVMNFEDEDLRIVLKDKQKLAAGFFNLTSEILKNLPTGFDPLCNIEGMRSWFTRCNKHQNMLVANFLVNQHIIAGIGNRYRSEIMHVSKIRPTAKVKDLSYENLQILLVNIYRILKAAARGEYTLEVVGQKVARYTNQPVYHVEVAKGVYVWTVFNEGKKTTKLLSGRSLEYSKEQMSEMSDKTVDEELGRETEHSYQTPRQTEIRHLI